MITNTQAIVVQTRKFRDNDRQVVLMSRELGKIQTVAWDVQKKHSALMSFCQMFNLGTVSLSKHAGKSFSLRQAQCENVFSGIKKDNLKFAASCFFVESLCGLIDYQQQEQPLFDLLKGYLYVMDVLDSSYCTGIQVVFLLRLMKICGYGLEHNTCFTYLNEVPESLMPLFRDHLGVRGTPYRSSSTRVISASDWELIIQLDQFTFGVDAFPQSINSNILLLLEVYLFSLLEFQPKSLSFYRQIRGF